MLIMQAAPVQAVTSHYWNAGQWGNAAQWASAILASLAICFALFKEGVLSWFWHPKLTVRLNPEYPDCVKTPLKHGEWWGSRYWIRLWIRNEGRIRAQKVEVFLARAWVERKADYWAELPHFTPMNLRWSYGNRKHPTIYADGISHRMAMYCDLAAITKPGHPDLQSVTDPEKTRLGLQFEFPGPAKEYLPTGKYRFEILVAARTAIQWHTSLNPSDRIMVRGRGRHAEEWLYCNRSKGLAVKIVRHCPILHDATHSPILSYRKQRRQLGEIWWRRRESEDIVLLIIGKLLILKCQECCIYHSSQRSCPILPDARIWGALCSSFPAPGFWGRRSMAPVPA